MKYPLYSHVVLVEDIPAKNLRRGDFATIVEYYEGRPDQQPGYEIEVFNAVGDTVAVVSVAESQIEPPRKEERLCVRSEALAA